MNCEEFQELMFEYLDGSLSAGERETSDAHLGRCRVCQQALQQEQQRAQFLSKGLRQEMAALTLNPGLRGHIEHNLISRPKVVLWARFAWPLGIAASLALVAAILLAGRSAAASRPVNVEASYREPVHVMRKEGNRIIDTMTFETVSVNQTLETR